MNVKKKRFVRCMALLMAFTLLITAADPVMAENYGVPMKSETVYARLTASGAVKDTTVVNWFHFSGKHANAFSDPVRLTDTKPMNGRFSVVSDNQGTVRLSKLPVNQRDVFYAGKANQQLPVDIRISYWLNGRPVQPQALVRASGDVKIAIKATNRLSRAEGLGYVDSSSGQKVTASKRMYTPLMTMVSVDLPIDKFSAVQAPDGIVTVVGETQKVNWILFPYPEAEAVLTMKADDFEMNGMSIMVQPKMPAMTEIKIEDKLVTLSDSLGKMDNALVKLETGADQIAGGQNTMKDGIIKLSEGLDQLITLNEAEVKLAQGALLINSKLLEQLKGFADNPMVGDKLKPVLEALGQQNKALTLLVMGGDAGKGQTIPAMDSTAAGLKQVQDTLGQLGGGFDKTVQGAAAVKTGVQRVRQDGVTAMQQGVAQAINQVRMGEAEKRAAEKRAAQYVTFLGKPHDCGGKVQFVYQTEEIKFSGQ